MIRLHHAETLVCKLLRDPRLLSELIRLLREHPPDAHMLPNGIQTQEPQAPACTLQERLPPQDLDLGLPSQLLLEPTLSKLHLFHPHSLICSTPMMSRPGTHTGSSESMPAMCRL